MKFPNKKDYLGNVEGYLDEVITTCLTIHKENVNDSLMKATEGQMTDEMQSQYFMGKQLFSKEPIYKLMRLIINYRNDKYINEKDDIMLTIVSAVEDAEAFVKSISKVNHDEELRNMATTMIQSGMSVQDISEELCNSGWYSWDDQESLQKTIHNWVKRYNLKW